MEVLELLFPFILKYLPICESEAKEDVAKDD
jgi:hypothetical protein